MSHQVMKIFRNLLDLWWLNQVAPNNSSGISFYPVQKRCFGLVSSWRSKRSNFNKWLIKSTLITSKKELKMSLIFCEALLRLNFPFIIGRISTHIIIIQRFTLFVKLLCCAVAKDKNRIWIKFFCSHFRALLPVSGL